MASPAESSGTVFGGQPQPPNSLLIGIPTAGAVSSEAFAALAVLMGETVRGWKQHFGEEVGVGLKVTSRVATDRARTDIAGTALAHGFDWILWLDDDMDPPPDLAMSLLRHNADMASGLYRLRSDKPDMLVYNFATNKAGERTLYSQVCRYWSGSLNFDATGFGCLLMKRKPLQYVWDKTDGKPFKYTKQWKSEDLFFFDIASQGGYKVKVDMDIKVGHVGNKTWVPPSTTPTMAVS